jgi:hypothetical protein
MTHLGRCLFQASTIASDKTYAEPIPGEFPDGRAAYSRPGSGDHNDF